MNEPLLLWAIGILFAINVAAIVWALVLDWHLSRRARRLAKKRGPR